MSLRTKSLLMISTTLAGMTAILLLSAAYIFQRGFHRLEQSSMQEKLHRVIADLSEDQTGLSRIVQDYSRSDEAYAFLASPLDQSGDSGYIQDKFSPETYLKHQLNLVAFIDASGRLLYGGEFDFTEQEIHELPGDFIDQLPSLDTLLSLAEPEKRSTPENGDQQPNVTQMPGGFESTSAALTAPQVLRLSQGPVLIAVQAVLSSSGQGPARGVMIFGRTLDSEIDLISGQTGLHISHEAWVPTAIAPQIAGKEAKPTSDFQAARDALSSGAREQATLQPGSGSPSGASKDFSEFIQPLNGETVAGYTVLNDITGEPDTLLKVETPREIFQQGQASLRTLMIVLVGAGLGFVLVITLLLEKFILSPLAQIRTAISSIGASGEFDERLPVSGKDELSNLASSINGMLLEALEQRSDDLKKRLLEIRTAAEVAQIATGRGGIDTEGANEPGGVGSSPTQPGGQKRLLGQTIRLIVERFGYANASIYLLDPGREHAVLAETTSEGNNRFKVDTLKLAVGSRSMVGWVTANNQPRVAGNVNEDPYYLKDDFLPNIRSEAVIPISTGKVVLGALDVQSHKPNAFQAGDVAVLQTLANQLATAIHNLRLLEVTQYNLEEASLLYQASRNIAQAESAEEVLRAVDRALRQTSYQSAVFTVQGASLRKIFPSGVGIAPLSERLLVTGQDLEALLPEERPFLIIDLPNSSTLPLPLIHLLRQWQCETAAFIPVKGKDTSSDSSAADSSAADSGRHRRLSAIFILGAQQRGALNPTSLQPYASLAEETATALQKVQALQQMGKSLAEVRTLNEVSQALSLQTNLFAIYKEIHHAVRQFMGEVDFLVALVDNASRGAEDSPLSDSGLPGRVHSSGPDELPNAVPIERQPVGALIRIPYMWEKGQFLQVDPFPHGEGLTSVVIRSRRPLRIIENTEELARKLGAVVIGKPAKSWLGVPLMVGGEVIGAIVVQDIDSENRFTEEDQRLLATLASQAAAAIRNASILEASRLQARRERLLREITGKIRSSVDMHTIVETAATELGKALNLSRTHIRAGLADLPNAADPQEPGWEPAEALQTAEAQPTVEGTQTSPGPSPVKEADDLPAPPSAAPPLSAALPPGEG